MTLLDHWVRELRETAVSVDEDAMRENDYGSILSTQGSIGAGAANDEELMYQVGLIDGGLIACTKHFLADGNVLYGTDDGIFCFIYVSTLDPALTTEAFESWFMDS